MRDEVDRGVEGVGHPGNSGGQAGGYPNQLCSSVELNFGPLVVYVRDGSHAHHLASLGLWWLALLVAEGPDINRISWAVQGYWDVNQSPLMVAVRAGRPVGRRWQVGVGVRAGGQGGGAGGAGGGGDGGGRQ